MKVKASFNRIALLFWSWLLLVPALVCVGFLAVFKTHGWDPEMGFGMLSLYQALIASLPAWGWIGLLGASCGLAAALPPRRASLWKSLPPTLINIGWTVVWVLSLMATHRGEWTFYSW